MDQRPRDLPPRTDWDRLPVGDDGSWSLVPVLIVVALLAVGAWLLFANSATTPTTTTSEHVPSPSATPTPKPPPPPGPSPRRPPPRAPSRRRRQRPPQPHPPTAPPPTALRHRRPSPNGVARWLPSSSPLRPRFRGAFFWTPHWSRRDWSRLARPAPP